MHNIVVNQIETQQNCWYWCLLWLSHDWNRLLINIKSQLKNNQLDCRMWWQTNCWDNFTPKSAGHTGKDRSCVKCEEVECENFFSSSKWSSEKPEKLQMMIKFNEFFGEIFPFLLFPGHRTRSFSILALKFLPTVCVFYLIISFGYFFLWKLEK